MPAKATLVATVPVPLDWRHPGGPSIDLAVIRHLASRPGQRIGSLCLNPGGPGDSDRLPFDPDFGVRRSP